MKSWTAAVLTCRSELVRERGMSGAGLFQIHHYVCLQDYLRLNGRYREQAHSYRTSRSMWERGLPAIQITFGYNGSAM